MQIEKLAMEAIPQLTVAAATIIPYFHSSVIKSSDKSDWKHQYSVDPKL